MNRRSFRRWVAAAVAVAIATAGCNWLRDAIARDACLDAGGAWHSPGGAWHSPGGAWHSPGGAWYAGTCRR